MKELRKEDTKQEVGATVGSRFGAQVPETVLQDLN